MKIELKKLSLDDGKDVYDFLKTLHENENGFGNPCYGIKYSEFGEFLNKSIDKSKGINLPKGYVSQTIYWLYIDGEIKGIGKIRTQLTEALRKRGGHIGYAVGPEYRGKGYGKILLAELLKEAKLKELKKVLLTCNENNIKSKKVIESNNGKLEDILNKSCRYWIKL